MTDPHAGADTPLDHKRRTARLYWLGLGVFGAHRFYLGLSLTGGLQHYGGAPEDPEAAYAGKVMAEKERIEQAARRPPGARA